VLDDYPLHKEIKISSEIFAQDIEGGDIKLITDNRLVVPSEKRSAVYDLTGNATTLKALIETKIQYFSLWQPQKDIIAHFLKATTKFPFIRLLTTKPF